MKKSHWILLALGLSGILIFVALNRDYTPPNIEKPKPAQGRVDKMGTSPMADKKVQSTSEDVENLLKDRSSFVLEKFDSLPDLQAELTRLLPLGTPITDVDKLILAQGKVFRTENLLRNWNQPDLFRYGTSSEENFVFYYKPNHPAGAKGWEETSSGWVIKIVHSGGGGLAPSPDRRRLVQVGQEGLTEVVVLTVPNKSGDLLPDQNVELAKELLQYKEDMNPVSTFDKVKWEKLVEEHKDSPCRTNLSYSCLMFQASSLLGLPSSLSRQSYFDSLASIALKYGDKDTAKKLIDAWPTRENIRKYEESIPRLRRQTPAGIEGTIRSYEIKLMLLKFIIGDHDDAERRLIALQADFKNGEDFGVIEALVKAVDFQEALKISKMTLEWKREVPDPLRGSSALGHCENFRTTRAIGMGSLATAFIKENKLDEAYQVAQLIRTYWEGKAFGQESYCYTMYAKGSYLKAMQGLLMAYAKQKDMKRAGEIYDEAAAVLKSQTKDVRRHNMDDFERLSKAASEAGIDRDTDTMPEFVKDKSRVDYPEVYGRYTSDPAAMALALAGKYQQAVDLVESTEYSKKHQPSEMERLLPTMKQTPDNEIKLTTYLVIAKSLAERKDKDGAMLFLDKAQPYMGSRHPEYDPAVANFTDYIDKANILLDLGERKKAEEVFDELMSRYSATTPADYRGGGVTQSFYGQVAHLFARLKSIQNVQQWADKLPTYYAGFYYSRIGALLIGEKRWEELDSYMPEMARVLSTDEEPIGNWSTFVDKLIQAGEFERYTKFLDMINEGTPETKARRNSSMGRIGPIQNTETPDNHKQIWMMSYLLVSKLSGDDVPQTILNTTWPRFISNCRFQSEFAASGERLPDEKETMAACYLRLVRGIDYRRQEKQRLQKE